MIRFLRDLKDAMTAPEFIWGVIVGLIFCLLLVNSLDSKAQNVTRKGNVFIQDSTSHKMAKDSPTLTKYFYLASDGTKYPIYISANGKCFIIRVSKNGKEYRQYLPEVTRALQDENRQQQ